MYTVLVSKKKEKMLEFDHARVRFERKAFERTERMRMSLRGQGYKESSSASRRRRKVFIISKLYK